MRNQFFRSHNLGFPGCHQALEVHVSGDQEVTLIGATEDQNVIGVHQAIPQSPYSWEQSLSLREIHRQQSQMVPDSFELRPASSIGGKKQFLKHYRVNGEADTAVRFGGKQRRCQRIALEISDDYVCVQEHKRPISVGTLALCQLGFDCLLHVFIVPPHPRGLDRGAPTHPIGWPLVIGGVVTM
jgi:hypothetical protein